MDSDCTKMLVNAGVSALNVFKAFLSDPVSQEEQDRRQKICEECTLLDSSGKRLFRIDIDGTATCGVSFLEKPFRDPEREGCGCLLFYKWRAKDQNCPRGRW